MAFHDSSPFNFPVASSNLKLKKYGDDSFGRHTGCDGGFKCGLALREEVLVLTTSLERIGDVWRGTNEAGSDGGCVLTVDGKRCIFLYWEAGVTPTQALTSEQVLLHQTKTWRSLSRCSCGWG